MERCWYYTYRALKNMGCRVCSTCVGDFDIYREMMRTESEVGESVVVDRLARNFQGTIRKTENIL